MLLTQEQLQTYEDMGFLLLPGCFSLAEIETLKGALADEFAQDSPRRVLEKDGSTVRSVYGSHVTNEVFEALACHPRLVEPAMQIVGSEVYVYQFKINAKAAFDGDVWEWHQDYVFWRNEDGMPEPRVVNITIFLDEVNEFNGPMLFIPGSHKQGVIDVAAQQMNASAYANSPAWISNLTANLKYSLNQHTIANLVAKSSIVAPKGPSGSVLFFHSNIAHGSGTNMSPFGRTIAIVTYNSVYNLPLPVAKPRPEFLASRDGRPVVPIADDVLLDAMTYAK